jgi:chemotaxis protein MotA
MKRFDYTVIFGLFIGLSTIILAANLEGLSLGFLWNPTAALIVGGGTLGAVIVRRGTSGVTNSIRSVWQLRYLETNEAHELELARLAWLAQAVRTKGLPVLESHAKSCDDVLVAQGLLLASEYSDSKLIKSALYRQLETEDEKGRQDIATLEAAGGFAPTFGIVGAVLGLIGVLREIDQPGGIGLGIAAAFVATIYGIALANLLFFPLASRLKSRHETRLRQREDLAEAVLALAAGETSRGIINRFNLKAANK